VTINGQPRICSSPAIKAAMLSSDFMSYYSTQRSLQEHQEYRTARICAADESKEALYDSQGELQP
jgi:hypothetical protein